MTNPLYCQTCTSHGEVGRLASYTEQTEVGEIRLCHHCKWLLILQKMQTEMMAAMTDMRKETLEVLRMVSENTAKIAALSDRFAGRN